MTNVLASLRDTRHLWTLAIIAIAAAAGLWRVRSEVLPDGFGALGPYRAAALTESAARLSVLQADATCLECHSSVGDERADSLHVAVACMHCHGVGRDHVRLARLSAGSAEVAIPPAAKWDGNFRTTIDLYTTKDRAICLACHEAVVGMPSAFKKIDVAQHLEEQGAETPESQTICLDCHGWHNTAP